MPVPIPGEMIITGAMAHLLLTDNTLPIVIVLAF